MSLPDPTVEIDARGFRCPAPTLKLQKAMAQMRVGEVVRLRADDPMAKVDVPHFANQAGHTLLSAEADRDAMVFLLRKGG